MYTGTLIEELMATVERAEQHTRAPEPVTEDIDRWFADPEFALLERNYQGVA